MKTIRPAERKTGKYGLEDLIGAVSAKEDAPFRRRRKKAHSNEVDLSAGVEIVPGFPDRENRLETAYDELRNVLCRWKVPRSGKYAIRTEAEPSLEPEEFILKTTAESCRILSGNIEGVRRGLYELSGILSGARAPFLPEGVIRKKFFVKNRVSRCFFGPIHRPPFNIDELNHDTDYYPEAFLNRLAREGINVLWLTVEFHEITCSSILPLEPEALRRLRKLRRIVEKCRRYGIRVFLFCIEPAGFFGKSEFLDKYPELSGVDCGFSMHCFCPDSPLAQKHLYEQTFFLFSEVPHLGGLIDIPAGEAVASCFSSGGSPTEAPVPFRCPRCGRLLPWQALNRSLEPLIRGMRDADPETEFLCWLYQPSGGQTLHPWVEDCASHLPDGATLIYNFESGIAVRQRGKVRIGGDYWQSKTGPSKRFLRMAEVSRKAHKPFGAKLQVCNAFEISTVPNIPVPGILYRKYKVLRKVGAGTVMYGWYFGTSSGFMHRFALRLACSDLRKSEEEFLFDAAREEWGAADAETVVSVWKLFARGFACYPVNDGIQYDGPFHHGIVWPLFAEAELRDLYPSWQPAEVSGDCIGACLAEYPLADAEAQCGKMARIWKEGLKRFLPLRKKHRENPECMEDLRMAEAAGLLLDSGWHIFRFYLLRRRLYAGDLSALDEMEEIVRLERKASQRMRALCLEDVRLGYQPEAQVHKFDPEKLELRIRQLKELLDKKIPDLRVRLRRGESPRFPDSVTRRVCKPDGSIHRQKTFTWSIDRAGEEIRVRFQCKKLSGNDLVSDQVYVIFGDRLCSEFPVIIRCGRTGTVAGKRFFHPLRTRLFDNAESWGMEWVVPRSLIRDNPSMFNIQRQYMRTSPDPERIKETSTYAAMMQCQHGSERRIDSWCPEAAPVALSPFIHPAGWGLLSL
ncbi:MAG: hypothetical protein BWY31_00936 [Lentisphaerae bacterium ADurb.Bin242]|nr:MAG: hypothetical protein BWY31_00936 [Lentisphaerae bacterium ADurb.Bin242]